MKRMSLRLVETLRFFLICATGFCVGPEASARPPNTSQTLQAPTTLAARLHTARNWAAQLQGLDQPGAVEALQAAHYDVLVIEPTRTDRSTPDFPTSQVVARLKASDGATAGRRKIVIAYVNVGQAEQWRWYWQPHWVAPTPTQPGNPDFLITIDPQWTGNYPVAFWDPRWQQIIATSPTSSLHKALDDGFDGIYMDWIEGYMNERVAAAATTQGINAQQAMIDFVALIRSTARARNNQFLIVPQNACELGYDRPNDYLPIIDAIGVEDIHFAGQGDVPWDDPQAGDIRTPDSGGDNSRQWFYQRLQVYQNAGVAVLSIDYCLIAANIEEAYRSSQARGYIPFVSQTPLDRLLPYYPVVTAGRAWDSYQ